MRPFGRNDGGKREIMDESYSLFILNTNKYTETFLNGSAGFVFKKAFEMAKNKGWGTCVKKDGGVKAFAVPDSIGIGIKALITYACCQYYPNVEDKNKKEFFDTIDIYTISDEDELNILLHNISQEDD